MIEVDAREFMAEGYLILRQVIPPEMLQPLRQSAERVLYRRWPQGISADTFQPMIHGLERYIDEDSANLVEFRLHENVLGTTRQLMGGVEVAPSAIFMMYNPVRDFGPWWWHRDVSPLGTKGPLQGLQQDTLANGPVHLHWNIALYDDDVFWLVPGSHRRFNSEAENRQLSSSEYEPIDGGMAIELEAGDGIVYLTPILHWGSNYSTKLRRTLQYTYRSFNNGSLSAAHVFHWTPDLVHNLPAHLASRFKHFLALWEREYDVMEGIFRAMIARDEAGFLHGLAELHAGEVGRMICVIYLSKIAKGAVRDTRGPVGSRFTREEGRVLWQRFAPFDRLLQVDEPYLVPGFQTKEPSTYNFNEIPTMEVDEFIASWDEQAEG